MNYNFENDRFNIPKGTVAIAYCEVGAANSCFFLHEETGFYFKISLLPGMITF